MKFLAAAFAAFFCASSIDAAQMTPQIMQKAVKVDRRTLRRLEEQDQQQLTSAHSLQFQQCTSLKIASPDDDIMFGDNYIEYTKEGKIVAELSYILFSVCETGKTCYYSDDSDVYMVDLATYMGSVVNYLPTQRENYCEACQEAQDYCEQDQDAAAADDDGAGDNEDGGDEDQEDGDEDEDEEANDDEGDEDEEDGDEDEDGDEENEDEDGDEDNDEDRRRRLRKLENNNNFEVVDCDTCNSRNCFQDDEEGDDNNNNENQVNDANIAAWVEELTECVQTDQVWGDANLYAGFICNSEGNGVEIGVFLNEDCSIYTNQYKYKNIMDQDYQGYLYNSQEIVTYPFLNDIKCEEDVEYITPEDYEEMQENGEDENQDNDEEVGDANEYCQGVFEENALSLYDCNGDGEQDEQDNDVEEEEDNGYGWYSYVLSADDVEDNQAVCKVLQTLEGEYGVVYDSDEDYGSGSIYTYNSGNSGFWGGGDNSAGLIVAIVIGVLVALVAIGFIIHSAISKPKEKKERLLNHNYEGSAMA